MYIVSQEFEMQNTIINRLKNEVENKILSLAANEKHNKDDDVERFLKPLLFYLKCLGVPWASSKEKEKPSASRVSKFLIRLFGWMLFVLNISSYIDYTLQYSMFRKTDTTLKITAAITYANEFFFKIINHLSLLFLAESSRGVQLVQIFRELSYPGLKIRQVSGLMLFLFLMVSFQIDIVLFVKMLYEVIMYFLR